MDTALWQWNGKSFSDKPVEYAQVIGETDLLTQWREENPQMKPEVVGYGRGPTIAGYERKVSYDRAQRLRRKAEELSEARREQERIAQGNGSIIAKKRRTIEQQWCEYFADCLDPNDTRRLDLLSAGVDFKAFLPKKHTIKEPGFYKPPPEEEPIPDDVERELLAKQWEAEDTEKLKWSSAGSAMLDRAREAEDRNLYGEMGLWLDPGTISTQMDESYTYRHTKKPKAFIKAIKERKRQVRQKLMIDWLHDDDDIGDLMYAREITDPRVKRLLKTPAPDQPLSRRKVMKKLAEERGETANLGRQ